MESSSRKPIETERPAAEVARRLPVFDREPLLEVFGEGSEDARNLLRHFRDNLIQRIADVRNRLEADETGPARDIAHTCKGSANAVGAYALGKTCADLEACLRRGDIAEGRELLPRLQSDFERAWAEMAEF